MVPALRPPVPLRPPPAGALGAAGVLGGQAVIDASKSLDSELLSLIDKALSKCAGIARADVMYKHFRGRGPTREECSEVIGKNRQGEPITRAMALGIEQHRVALKCAEDELKTWREYREGHTYEGHTQGDLYKQALKVDPARVQPHLGVLR